MGSGGAAPTVMNARVAERMQIDWGDPRGGCYTIGEVVGLAGVPASTIHHYRRLGLIPEAVRTASNQPRYDDRHVAALTIVRSLRRRGCSLEEIREVLPGLLAERGCAAGDGLALAEQVGDHSPEARLIDTAIDAFAEQGYSEVSVTALCERADVAKGTFYRCFDSKETLFLATARAIIERATASFDAEAATIPAPDQPAALAGHLRRGLPVLFELAKRITQEAGPSIGATATMFAGLGPPARAGGQPRCR